MKRLVPFLATALLAACATSRNVDPLLTPPGADAVPPAAEAPVAQIANNDPALAKFFDDADRADLAESPYLKAVRGIRDQDYGRWDDYSEHADAAHQQRLIDDAARLAKSFDPSKLSPSDALSFRLFAARAKRQAAIGAYRGNSYVFDQMNGEHKEFPAVLINYHSVANEQQARDYVSRISGIGPALDQLIAKSAARAANGVMPPKWVYPLIISDIDSTLASKGDPALTGNSVLDDFRGKLAKLDVPEERKAELAQAAVAAWKASAAPAYGRLRTEMQRQQVMAGNDDGVWRLPEGKRYYDTLLATYTTTNLTADEIHDLGLRETARIQGEMRAIMRKVGFRGGLAEFFEHARTDSRFFPATREAYLAETQGRLDAMSAALPQWFSTLPKDRLQVKPVEAFREKTATKAFYSAPAPDGSRPGIYYVNLYDLKAMSRNEIEALAYHEGIPGHHLQRSIQYALGKVPAFRRFGGVVSYSEGWGLYAEQLGKGMGFYTDPYSDFGRLSMEILRAGRLVTDTGIHSKRWTRQQAIDWYLANTPVTRGDVVNQVERFVVYPGQATAYTVGKLKIVELRERARKALGPRFDIRAFHDVVLMSGPVPLDVLEENVDAWIAKTRA